MCLENNDNFDSSEEVQRGSNRGQEIGRVGVSSVLDMPSLGLIIPGVIIARETTVPAIQ